MTIVVTLHAMLNGPVGQRRYGAGQCECRLSDLPFSGGIIHM